MTYSCTDFTDTILDALDITVPDAWNDSPSDQADLCLHQIAELKRFELGPRALHTVLAALTYWQGVDTSGPMSDHLRDVLTKVGRIKPLSDAEIDELCKLLSTPETAPPAPESEDEDEDETEDAS